MRGLKITRKKPTQSDRPVELNPYSKNNYGVPKGTTSGKDAAGREVYYAPGSAPRYSVKSKSYSIGQAEGPTSLNKKGMKNVGKVSRLNKKIYKVGEKRDAINKSDKNYDKKFDRLTKKRTKLVTKKNKYFE